MVPQLVLVLLNLITDKIPKHRVEAANSNSILCLWQILVNLKCAKYKLIYVQTWISAEAGTNRLVRALRVIFLLGSFLSISEVCVKSFASTDQVQKVSAEHFFNMLCRVLFSKMRIFF